MQNSEAIKQQKVEPIIANINEAKPANQAQHGQNQTSQNEQQKTVNQIKPQTSNTNPEALNNTQNQKVKQQLKVVSLSPQKRQDINFQSKTTQQKPQPQHNPTIKNENQISNSIKNLQTNKPTESKKFQLQLSNYLFTFQLLEDSFIIKGQAQAGRKSLKQTYSYNLFTQQMKALFQSTDQIWTILQSAQQSIEFQDSKLYFKIHIGGKQKRIQIPLKDHDSSDQQYIHKLQRIAKKYKDLSQKLQQDLSIQKNQCTCKIQPHITRTQPINPKAKGKIKIVKIERNQSSRASSTWPDAPIGFTEQDQLQSKNIQQEKDPLVQFEHLIQKLSIMRDQYHSCADQIQQKIINKAGIKILKIKLMALQKKKKDYFYELDLQKIKFANLKCRNDIYTEIDEFLDYICQRYSQIEKTINLIRDEKLNEK